MANRNGGMLTKRHELASRQRQTVEASPGERKEKPRPPRLRVYQTKDGTALTPDHPEPAVGTKQLMDALGTCDGDFLAGLLVQLAKVGTQGQNLDDRGTNFMLAMTIGAKPQDEIEAMLAAQMAAIHSATMMMARRLNHVENIPQQDSAERALNKLARTFAAQVEALKRYRSSGEQKMTVEHVTVNEGGQALVGQVSGGGRGPSEKSEPTS